MIRQVRNRMHAMTQDLRQKNDPFVLEIANEFAID